ncbi:MAG: helix-turn-helix transcriptional regulator [Eubacteriales bacterium]|nr:helix-turn-helix transcriptional regulator [Eubacteriales bacterium]
MKNAVKKVRELRKMTLAELSAASGVPVSTINDVERGAEPRVITALLIAKALGTQVERLWFV